MSDPPDEVLPGEDPELFRAALEALPVAAVIGEAGGTSARILAVNRRFEQLLGWSAEELVGHDAVASGLYVGPIVMSNLASTLDDEGALLQYESNARHRDGGLRRLTNSTCLFEAGGHQYSVSTSVPVDDVELADALHESENRLQAVLDAIPFLFAVIEADGRVRMANRALYRQTGRTPEEVLGRLLDEVFTPPSAEAMRGYLGRLASGADLEVQETAFRDGDRVRRFRTSCFPLRRGRGPRAGRPDAMGLLAVDVTDERATEAALRESDVRFRQLAGSIDDAFVLTEGDPPRVLYASPSLSRVFGVERNKDVLSDPSFVERTTHPDDLAMLQRFRRERLHSDGDLDYEHRIVRPDGEVRWLRVRSSRVRSDGQPVDRVATILSDVTDRKQAELELRAAWAAAEEANQRKNDFLSRMSHELRTPLNAILGFTQLLELDELTADQASNLAHVARAGRHLLELINDVLDVSRIESGELRLSVGAVDLAEAVLETVAMMRPLLDGSDVDLDLPLDGHSVTVRADRQRLVQVLLNLLTNAVKFNRPGGRAAVRWSSVAADRVRIEVADTGIGMSPDDVDRLFTPFERFEPTIDGTGIGLVLTRQLVEAMGGTIEVGSVVGEGTTVAVELPGRHTTDPVEPLPRDDGPVSSRRLVLCVEPLPAETERIRRALALMPGAELVVVGSSAEAATMAAADPPALVLIGAPRGDGQAVELVTQLRARPATAAATVAVMGAEPGSDEHAALAALGVHRFLVVPYRLSQLLEVFEAALEP